jgi:hypothetical protein
VGVEERIMADELKPVEPIAEEPKPEPILAEKLFAAPVVKSTTGGRLPQSMAYHLEYGPADSPRQFQDRIDLKAIPEALRTVLLDNGVPQLEAWLKEA